MLGRWPLLLHQVSLFADQTIDMQNTQTLAKHTRDTVEILVSLKLMQTGKPDEAEMATDQEYTIAD